MRIGDHVLGLNVLGSPLLGTLYLVVISLVIATPIGVLAAVFLNEYARESWFTRIVNLAVVNLAGVPSIVHALFGLGAFVLHRDFRDYDRLHGGLGFVKLHAGRDADLTMSLAKGARNRGVKVIEDIEVIGVLTKNGAVTGVAGEVLVPSTVERGCFAGRAQILHQESLRQSYV